MKGLLFLSENTGSLYQLNTNYYLKLFWKEIQKLYTTNNNNAIRKSSPEAKEIMKKYLTNLANPLNLKQPSFILKD